VQLNNEKVKDKSEGKGVGKVVGEESLLVASPPNVQAELSNEATPGKIVLEEVVLEAAIEAEDHVKKSEAALQAEATKLQRDSPLVLDSDKLKKEGQEIVVSDKPEVGVEEGNLITEPLTKEAEPPEEAVKVGVAVDEGASNSG
jgi:hypothetical protein